MKKKLSYLDWSQWFADQCDKCNGSQTVRIGGFLRRCGCQLIATAKARLEAVDIVPSSLKYCNWSDFTGLIKDKGEIRGSLTTESTVKGRNLAFRYCFGVDYDPNVARDPTKIRLNDRIADGNNLVITGPENSGKTLLSVLVLKEACNAYVVGKNIQFKWVKFYDIINHARWDTKGKNINHALLDDLSELDLLFIDGIDDYRGGHNSPPDHISMNVLFGARRIMNLPTVFVCSSIFAKMLSRPEGQEKFVNMFGDEFVRSVANPNNTFIELKKS